jgi:maltose O-acetyltransferase
MLNHIINLFSFILPATRLFGLKKFLYQFVGFEFGRHVSIGNSLKSYVQGSVLIGNNVWLGRSLDFTVPLGSTVIVGSNVDVGPYVKFICGSHRVGGSSRRAGPGCANDIIIGDGCWIGAAVVILGGANIGSGVVIAAGAVVIAGDYPDNALLAGVPARVVKELSDSQVL